MAVEGEGPSLQLVQFYGPIRQNWLDEMLNAGIVPVHYLNSNGYLVWAYPEGREYLRALQESTPFLQYTDSFHPYYKVGPTLVESAFRNAKRSGTVRVTIQIYDHPTAQDSRDWIESKVLDRLSDWTSVLNYSNLIAVVDLADVAEIAARPDVVYVGERLERELFDEVQAQIIAGNFNANQSGPAGPGYLDWLNGLGFSQDPSDYPVLDITDDGIGNGAVNSGDPTLHMFGDMGMATRLAYVDNCTDASIGESIGGHGHINASIAVGYDTRTDPPFLDEDGFNRGLGMNPYGAIAGTRIFDPVGFDLSACGGTDTGLIESSFRSGAVISSNSWGCSGCAGTYDDGSQAWDVGVRDADLSAPGNQELIVFFSAGNSGSASNTIGTPGNGKNMITVGASENDRPDWTDGCGVGPSGADNAMEIINFSSRGPAPGGRTKPELIAPGTHIQGTASTSPSYNGTGVCDRNIPTDQTIFAASSGTSHSTPAVAGVGSLVHYWIRENLFVSPDGETSVSPALMKAYLMAHTTYLTSGNATLPDNSQGYGMPNLIDAFDQTPRYLLDQSQIFDNTGDTWSIIGGIANSDRPIKIALAFTDQAGMINATNPVVNNLDLEVIVNGEIYKGNVFSGALSITGGDADPANNYEAVYLPAGTSGQIEIRVIAANIAGDGVPQVGDGTDQDFAIVAYNVQQSPDFFLSGENRNLSVCAPENAVYNITVGSILDFIDPVTLDVADLPSGATAQLSQTTVVPGNNVTLTISGTDAVTPGSYTFRLVGESSTGLRETELSLLVADQIPVAPTPDLPADAATEVGLNPLFSWNQVDQSAAYLFELSTENTFTDPMISVTVTSTSFISLPRLASFTNYFWRVRASNVCGDGAFSATRSFTTLDQPDYFTQENPGGATLNGTTLTFTPDGSGDFYDLCRSDSAGLPSDPSGGTVIPLTDDDSDPVTPDNPVSLYGIEYNQLWVGSNGYLTFEGSDTSLTESLAAHFNQPRISAIFDDLNPEVAGEVSVKNFDDHFAVTYDGVTEFGTSNNNTFQIRLFHNGIVDITYENLAITDGIIGLSAGNGTPEDYLVSDFAGAFECCIADFNQDGDRSMDDLFIIGANWGTSTHDLDGSGVTNILDTVIVVDNLGPCQ
jgi:hypothetical protein